MVADPRYPIGEFEPAAFSHELKEQWLADIRYLPAAVEAALHDLDEQQLHTPYRAGGWTVHQLVHHIADSHMNAYCRFKLGYTEERPTVKPYDEGLWVQTADVSMLPVNISVTLLHALHLRWSELLRHFEDWEWERTVYHPGLEKELTLWQMLGMYAWHGRHHVAHINALREVKGW